MAWYNGPLPPDTWHWGAVVLVGQEEGFYFADFHGDHVTLVPSDEIVKADEVALYCNDIRLPQNCGRDGRLA